MHTVDSHGAKIPALGFGTFRLDHDDALRMVTAALDIGYRHIDTAQLYGNEASVGEALAGASVSRDEVFLTTKVWIDKFHDGPLQRSVEGSLKKLRVDAVDLLLLHWPNPQVPLRETLRALCEVKRSGMARHIGVSNFTVALLAEVAAQCEEPIVANQVEYHPRLSQAPVLERLRADGVSLTAYSPLAQGALVDDEVLGAIGAAHGKSASQVALRWLIQQEGVSAIPRTRTESRARANFEIFDFALSDDEMARVGALARPDGRVVNPGIAPRWDT